MRWDIAMLVMLAVIIYPGTAEPGGDGIMDHSAYDSLLKKYVDGKGMVDYRAWKVRDVDALDEYLKMIQGVNPARIKERNELFAFWINTYNALTIRGMLVSIPLVASEIMSANLATIFGKIIRSVSRVKNIRWMLSSMKSCAKWANL